jgi:hypothetical protein
VSRLVLAGGAVAGGAATVIIAEKAGLTPLMAGVATSGTALAASTIVQNPMIKDALLGASLGAGGLVGVQMFAKWWAERKAKEHTDGAAKDKKRQAADADVISRDELNRALAEYAERHGGALKAAHCDLLAAMREEMRAIVAEESKAKVTPVSRAASGDDERNAYVDDEYARNAYGDEERNAGVDDEYARNAYGDEERNAGVDDEYWRNGYGDEERNAYGDEERNAYGDEERNAGVDEERNAGNEE